LGNSKAYSDRQERERSSANNTVLQAALGRYQDDPDRAAQLAEFVLDAADPQLLDYETLGLFLARLRDRAPDLSDPLFERALRIAVSERNTASFSILGKYIFTSARLNGRPDTDNLADSYPGTRALLYDFSQIRESAHAEQVSRYIEALTEMAERQVQPTYDRPNQFFDLESAMYLMRFLGQHAEALELPEATGTKSQALALESRLTGQPAQPVGLMPQLKGAFSKNAGTIAARTMLEMLARARTKEDFDRAREFRGQLGEIALRMQLDPLADFAEAAVAVSGSDMSLALPLANRVSGGVKRPLLYAGIIPKVSREDGRKHLSVAIRAAALLPPEFRAAMTYALAAAQMRKDPDQAFFTLTEAILAQNAALAKPRSWRFDPRGTRGLGATAGTAGTGAGTDVASILLSKTGFTQVIDTGRARLRYPLKVAGVEAFTLPEVIRRVEGIDLTRIEATILELKDESQRADALLALADLRFRRQAEDEVREKAQEEAKAKAQQPPQ
jgi:hypothetical protein